MKGWWPARLLSVIGHQPPIKGRLFRILYLVYVYLVIPGYDYFLDAKHLLEQLLHPLDPLSNQVVQAYQDDQVDQVDKEDQVDQENQVDHLVKRVKCTNRPIDQ